MADGVMPQRFHLRRPDLATAVTAALAEVKGVQSHRRWLAMRLAASGQFTAAQLAEPIGVSRRQFFHWVNALKLGGVEQLLERDHGGGQPAPINGTVLRALQSGLRAGRWKRAKEIQQWLGQRHETELSVQGVYYWLGKLGGVLKVPRKAHAQKDAPASVAFQQTLGEQRKNLNVAGGRPVRVWVADEPR